jgi:transmembrane sensor
MKSNDYNKGSGSPSPDDLSSRFRGGKISWARTSDEAWSEIESRLDEKPVSRLIRLPQRIALSVAAAVLLVMVATGSFMWFYSKTYTSLPGEHLVVNLPDGSVANLNVNSSIKYHPNQWKYSRQLELDGEAYFEVEKGRQFSVVSSQGSTVVLGTVFNVLARDSEYEVTCLSGKVKIIAANSGNEAIITGDQKAVLKSEGDIEVNEKADTRKETSWTRNEFYFTGEKLENVFREIGMQYGVTIQYSLSEENLYTGYFMKEDDLESVLDLVCIPFGIKFEKNGERSYRIIRDEQK